MPNVDHEAGVVVPRKGRHKWYQPLWMCCFSLKKITFLLFQICEYEERTIEGRDSTNQSEYKSTTSPFLGLTQQEFKDQEYNHNQHWKAEVYCPVLSLCSAGPSSFFGVVASLSLRASNETYRVILLVYKGFSPQPFPWVSCAVFSSVCKSSRVKGWSSSRSACGRRHLNVEHLIVLVK